MVSNLLPEVDSLPDGFVDTEEANRITTNNPTGDVSIEKTKKPRTFPVPLCEEETDGNEDDLSKVSSLELKEPSQTCERDVKIKIQKSLRDFFVTT